MSYRFSPLRSSAADGPADRRTGSSAGLTLESLGRLTCPQLFHRILDELEAAIPGAERVVLPATGHAIHGGNPDATMRAIEHFLDRKSEDPMSPGAGAPEEL